MLRGRLQNLHTIPIIKKDLNGNELHTFEGFVASSGDGFCFVASSGD